MAYRTMILLAAGLSLALGQQAALAQTVQPPGLVQYLYHTQNMPQPSGQQTRSLPGGGLSSLGLLSAVPYPPVPPAGSVTWIGGDLGASSGHGFRWFAVADSGGSTPSQWRRLPPGVVVALKHSVNQANAGIVAFGQFDPVTGPAVLDGFVQRHGGDRGAPSGQGYSWYESTDTGDTDWSLVNRLPAGTVIGLRHTQNLRGTQYQFVWQGGLSCRLDIPGNPPAACDPTNPQIIPPTGFVRVMGGDRGAPGGQGFVWYQKQ